MTTIEEHERYVASGMHECASDCPTERRLIGQPQPWGRTVWVLTWQGDDPFVAGGVPIYASTDEQDVWDTAAMACAHGVDEIWRGRLRYLRGRRTQTDIAAGIAHGYQVFPLKLVEEAPDMRTFGDS